jgi:hypothetical protein
MPADLRIPDQRLTAGVTVFAPDIFEPSVVGFINTTVEILVLKRRALIQKRGIDRHWAGPGIYVLIGAPAESAFQVRARPGSASDLIKRIHEHYVDPKMDWFKRVVLIQDTRQGFNSAEFGFIEGRLHELCKAACEIEHVYNVDTDETLQAHEEAEFERRYIPQICSVLELIGVPLETPAQSEAEESQPYRRRPDAWAKTASEEADTTEAAEASAVEQGELITTKDTAA